MNTHTVTVGSFEPCSPVASAAGTAGTPHCEALYAVELPPSLADGWRGDGPRTDERAVITMAWVEDVGLVAVLLTHPRDVVALVLDPSQQSVADAVDQWRQRGRSSNGVWIGGRFLGIRWGFGHRRCPAAMNSLDRDGGLGAVG